MKGDNNWTRRTSERDWAIWRAICDGSTLAATGAAFGLSRERVRQIYAKHQRRRGLDPHIVRDDR